MKINKSTICFKASIKKKPDGSNYTVAEIPYWRLYSAKGDACLPTNTRLDEIKTFDEIVDWLQKTDDKRNLIAYPRMSKNERPTYDVSTIYFSYYYDVIEKYTGEIVATFEPEYFHCTYIAPHCKKRKKYFLTKVAFEAARQHLITYEAANHILQYSNLDNYKR